jgi:zinc and cadmium transporter
MMVPVWIAAIVSTLLVSLISVLVAVPFFWRKKVPRRTLLFLLSISVGVLLATVFLEFLPEAYEHASSTSIALTILAGFLLMFIVEKIVHWHHSTSCEEKDSGHSHAYSVAPVNLIGDALHNFLDGLVIAGAYMVNVHVGIVATLAVAFHEIPQEIADFGVLLYSGLSKMKALLFNLLSAFAAVIGCVIGLLLAERSAAFALLIIPFSAGNFIYIAAANLIPQLHRETKWKSIILHVFAILLGVALMLAVEVMGPSHEF